MQTRLRKIMATCAVCMLTLSGCGEQSMNPTPITSAGYNAKLEPSSTPQPSNQPVAQAGAAIQPGQIRWNKTLDGFVSTSPIVSDGILYVTNNQSLSALDTKTGDLLWQFPVESLMALSPVLADKIIYFATEAYNADPSDNGKGSVYAIDPTNHAEKWKLDIEEDGVSNISVVGEAIFFAGAHLHQGGDTRSGGHIYRVDAKTGTIEWSVPTIGDVQGVPGPTVVEDTLYYGDGGTFLYALDANTGQQKWKFAAEDTGTTSPIIAGDTLYFLSGNYIRHNFLYAIDRVTGQLIWKYQKETAILAFPTISDGTIYLNVNQKRDNCPDPLSTCTPPDYNSNFYALDKQTGQEKWKLDINAYGQGDSNPIVENGLVYVQVTNTFGPGGFTPSPTDHIIAVDTTTGLPRWVSPNADAMFGQPTVDKGIVYVGDLGHDFWAIGPP